MSVSETCSNQLQLDHVYLILVNFLCELGKIGGSFERKKFKVGLKMLLGNIWLLTGQKNGFSIQKAEIQSSRLW